MSIPVPPGFYEEFNEAVKTGGGEHGLIPAPLGMPGVVDHGTHYLGRTVGQYIDGRHFTDYPGDVVRLKRQGKLDDAVSLLLRICDVLEADPSFIPPWYYEQLAIIYAKQKRFADAITICERYETRNKGRGGRGVSRLAIRGAKLRAKHL